MSDPIASTGTVSLAVRGALPMVLEEAVLEVARAVRLLIDEFQPHRIYIFGSQASGDTTAGSDVDLLIVVPVSALASHQRAQSAYRAIGPHTHPMDIIVMTQAEFDARRNAVGSLAATVLREGRVVYAA